MNFSKSKKNIGISVIVLLGIITVIIIGKPSYAEYRSRITVGTVDVEIKPYQDTNYEE